MNRHLVTTVILFSLIALSCGQKEKVGIVVKVANAREIQPYLSYGISTIHRLSLVKITCYDEKIQYLGQASLSPGNSQQLVYPEGTRLSAKLTWMKWEPGTSKVESFTTDESFVILKDSPRIWELPGR